MSYASSRKAAFPFSDDETTDSSSTSSSQSSRVDLSTASFATAAAPILTLDTTLQELNLSNYTGSIFYVESFDDPPSPRTENSYTEPSPTSDDTPTGLETVLVAEDDTAIKVEPTRHVDYLSHEWREEDIWSSWRHVVSKRKLYGERSRLENAAWRTWTKQKNKLKTVSPHTLNWLKDCDVTWLYGPLQTASTYTISQSASEGPPSTISKNNSFLNKKPILKKRSMSEVMLQKSLSTSSLVKQAAAAVQAQQSSRARIRDRPLLGRAQSDFVASPITSKPMSREGTADYPSSSSTSGLQTPDAGKHIRFADEVKQCIAVEEDEEEEESWFATQEDSSDDEGLVMMKKMPMKRKPPRKRPAKSSIAESKTIERLPSTTLKYRTESPDFPEQPNHSIGHVFWKSGKLSPSPSQETLRPSDPTRNFLLAEEDDDDDDDDDDGLAWNPSPKLTRRDSTAVARERGTRRSPSPGGGQGSSGGLRRTESGMLMPDDGEDGTNPGILSKVVDTVNTAKDIAHVIWNVGWRK
ncbi:hypothetical protein EJ06DRAFT_481689 [Trichodelitschia bisporula]|uniref:Nitrogen regulatory protein areA GATA-like domain-containing protein n=1 Tax=Trichodelitschia bisporula TaxID=703511 RepID=A0A6G1HN12_9PEZI|nr:hypothetical protein EJ06DRAFT_481689 [Trichodelitschia bisporula]